MRNTLQYTHFGFKDLIIKKKKPIDINATGYTYVYTFKRNIRSKKQNEHFLFFLILFDAINNNPKKRIVRFFFFFFNYRCRNKRKVESSIDFHFEFFNKIRCFKLPFGVFSISVVREERTRRKEKKT